VSQVQVPPSAPSPLELARREVTLLRARASSASEPRDRADDASVERIAELTAERGRLARRA
jgi:hypothetical protein